ncbi:MAG: hypothetical protein IJV32_00050 [Bacteroidales bacterium]|nr:hypothetical protein [Bacteroidales bacterium]
MNTSHPKSSGFDDDIDVKFDNMNARAELLEDTAKLDQYLEHVDGKLYRAEELMKESYKMITRIESATGALERSANKIKPALNSLADNISKDKRFKFTAQLSDKSIESIRAEHGEFIKEEEELLKGHRAALKKSFSESVAEEKQAFENHKIEMERTKEYGQGVWFSQKAWNWIFGILLVCGIWFVASVTVFILVIVQS